MNTPRYTSPAKQRSNDPIHYAMFDKKTLCGIPAIRGEEFLTDKTRCKVCLKQAILMHFQMSNLAARMLKELLQ